jgi:hypothetical protein
VWDFVWLARAQLDVWRATPWPEVDHGRLLRAAKRLKKGAKACGRRGASTLDDVDARRATRRARRASPTRRSSLQMYSTNVSTC